MARRRALVSSAPPSAPPRRGRRRRVLRYERPFAHTLASNGERSRRPRSPPTAAARRYGLRHARRRRSSPAALPSTCCAPSASCTTAPRVAVRAARTRQLPEPPPTDDRDARAALDPSVLADVQATDLFSRHTDDAPSHAALALAGAPPPSTSASGRTARRTVAAVGGLPLSAPRRRVASVLLQMPFTLPFDSRLRVLRRWLSADREARLASILMGQPHNLITVRQRPPTARRARHSRPWLAAALAAARAVPRAGQPRGGWHRRGRCQGVLGRRAQGGLRPRARPLPPGGGRHLYPSPATERGRTYALYEFLGAILAKVLYEGPSRAAARPLLRLQAPGRTNTVADLRRSMPRSSTRSCSQEVRRRPRRPHAHFRDRAVRRRHPPRERAPSPSPRGDAIAVTAANRLEYVALVSHYRLTHSCVAHASTCCVASRVVPAAW